MIYQGRIRLRRTEAADARHHARWRNDADTRANLYKSLPQTVAQTERQLARFDDVPEHVAFMIEAPDDGMNYLPVGGCGLHDVDYVVGCAELGIVIDRDHQGRGYGTDAVRALVGCAFDDLNLRRVELLVLDENAPAIRCYEKVGFRREAVKRASLWKRGAWRDQVVMGILRGEVQP